MSILLLLGNEPEKVKRHISRLTEEVNLPEMNILQVDGPIADENTIEFCYTSPLMSAQKLFIVKYDKLTTDPILQRILESNPSITTICVVAADIDKRSKISKLLKANTIKCNKFSLQEITKYINNTIEKQNLSATDEIIQEFILRTGYFENDTISFITLRNQLEQLCNYLVATHSKTVTMDIVDRLLPFTATTGIWKLLEVLEAGNSKLLFDSAHYLIHEDSNAIGIMSALAYNIRIAFKASFFGDISPYEIAKRLGVYNINSNPFLHYNSKKLSLMIDIIQDGIKSIKNGSNQMMILDIVLAKLLYVCNPKYSMFKLILPKIPAHILVQAYSLFLTVSRLYNSECILYLFYNRELNQYFLSCPSQRISRTNVTSNRNLDMEKKYLYMGSIHSHGRLDAFFSRTDDRDDIIGIHGVFGGFDDYDKMREKFIFRYACGSITNQVKIEEVFEDLSSILDSYGRIKQFDELFVQKMLATGKIKPDKEENWN